MVDAPTLEECGGFSVSEYKQHLNDYYLSSQENAGGWVFWRPDRADESSGSNNINDFGESIRERIRLALDKLTLWRNFIPPQYLAQFWAPKVNGGKRWLATLDPFAVGSIDKGSCWYRRRCMNHYYVIDNGGKGEQLGPPERAFRNGHPESTPDLCLYSVKEFPLRDILVRSGFRRYLVSPVFDSRNQCVGVLEIVSPGSVFNWRTEFVPAFRIALEAAGLSLTHCRHLIDATDMYMRCLFNIFPDLVPAYKLNFEEIRDMLELAIQVLPQLHLAQVWVPCNQCTNRNNNLCCMERLAFISVGDGKVCRDASFPDATGMGGFLKACEFHNVQAGKGVSGIAFSSTNKLCFCRNISGLSIIDYPLAHYAQKISLFFVFSICLQSKNNENNPYVFEFYLHIRDDAHTWSFLQLLLKIMEMKLESFRVESGKQLGDELIVEVCKKNMLTSPGQEPPNVSPVGYEIIQHGQAKKYFKEFTMVMPMESYHESYSIYKFKAFFNEIDLSSLEVKKNPKTGWFFRSLKVVSEAEVNDNSLLLPNPIQEKINTLFRAIASRWGCNTYYLVQFWAPKMIEGKYCLSTSDQPFALGILCKGLCWYKEQCMEHHYFVGEGAKEEDLGPPGRVFQSRHPESSPDIRLYSIKELPLRDHAAHCGLRRYLALPVFDANQMQCIGILECLERGHDEQSGLIHIRSALEEANLTSTPFCFWSNNKAISCGEKMFRKKAERRKQASSEIKEMLELASRTPELRLTQVWVPCFDCANKGNGWRCMKREQYSYEYLNENLNLEEFLDSCNSHQVQIGKGVAGIALQSENGSCFCRNLCDFSITEQPLAHYAQRARLDICFAICLQSSYTSNALYVLEFFLASGSTQGGYSQSLSVPLQLMKQKLKSFKVASGQQLGDELVVDVIESGKEKKLSQSTYPDCFPIRFNIIQYSQEMENENSRNKQVHSDHNGMNDGMNISDAEQSDIAAANLNKEVITNKTKRSRKETSFHINLADLKPHFGKRLEDVATELGVGKSTLKRACRRYGIERWPGKEGNKRNPSLFLKENAAANHFQDRNAETSISSGTKNPSLDLTAHQNKPHANTESTQQLAKISCEETNMMMVKAKFKDDTMKFQISISSGMEKLTEEVGKRLKLKIGSFKLKYLDEGDDEWILLACEEDFQLCVKTLTAVDKTCIQVLVQLI